MIPTHKAPSLSDRRLDVLEPPIDSSLYFPILDSVIRPETSGLGIADLTGLQKASDTLRHGIVATTAHKFSTWHYLTRPGISAHPCAE
jgi:hypothetical protein